MSMNFLKYKAMEFSVHLHQTGPDECNSPMGRLSSDVDRLQSDLQRTLLDYAELKLRACAILANDVTAKLADGDGAAARISFQSAEQAFESVQRCIPRLEREDWRTQTEVKLDEVGTKLDVLWVQMISSGFPVL